ncbi:DUF3303 domain-containing protein [Methanosarcina sp. KYL-1]|uniref:DUF3303 domain-containing protein n=1 Tax=Methanosarcina sp. KYL-1 TaxID=2602068 RepID=UPI002100FFF6|nr:DUF3303 family protein [Methanosarcina sp. KYL-1]
MDIVSWEPEDSVRVGEIFSTYEYPKGIKVIDEWVDLSGCRSFIIYETDDPEAYIASIQPFMELCWFETFPIMKAKKYMQTVMKPAGKSGVKGHGEAAKLEGAAEEEILKQIEGLEKRVHRLEHHSFLKQEDTPEKV